jgi:cytochrome c oxidase assembly protein subunit 15
MSREPAPPPKFAPGLFALALATLVTTFPLIVSGGTVTTLQVGMVDDQAVREPWLLLTLSGIEQALERGVGWCVEHGHRQIGWIVGVLAIGLAIGTWRRYPGRRLRWLGVVVLAAVASQGVLGMARIALNVYPGVIAPHLGRDLALVHGLTGQLTFAVIAAATLMLSRSWLDPVQIEDAKAARFRRFCLITLGLFILQLASAVLLRHLGGVPLLIVHLLLAAAVFTHVILLRLKTSQQASSLLRFPASVLLALVNLMLLLGVGAWWFGGGEGQFNPTPIGLHRAVFATAHQALGAVLLALMTVITLRAFRHLPAAAQFPAPASALAEVGA